MLLFRPKSSSIFCNVLVEKQMPTKNIWLAFAFLSFIIPYLTSTIYILERLYELNPLLISVSNEKNHQNG